MSTPETPMAAPPRHPPPRADPVAALFDPVSWRERWEAYTRSTHLAVALVDAAGRLLGPGVHPRPPWRRVQAVHNNLPQAEGICAL